MSVSPGAAVVGLRVDVDTFRGTRDGVPALLETLAAYGHHATFFFSVGPDNMGRHLWRLANPRFLHKMLRSRAVSLYGWDILRRGVFWPGAEIGPMHRDLIRHTASIGHEIGLHAWDHHAWQSRLYRMSQAEVRQQVDAGFRALQDILGDAPTCSAAAGWICNDLALLAKEEFGFTYNSDCRGHSIFRPLVNCRLMAPQIPVTLPTYDEVIGVRGITDRNYNRQLIKSIRPGVLNVLTIHAEVEGMAKRQLFCDFLHDARRENIHFLPLGKLLPNVDQIPGGNIGSGRIEGRAGRFCQQEAA